MGGQIEGDRHGDPVLAPPVPSGGAAHDVQDAPAVMQAPGEAPPDSGRQAAVKSEPRPGVVAVLARAASGHRLDAADPKPPRVGKLPGEDAEPQTMPLLAFSENLEAVVGQHQRSPGAKDQLESPVGLSGRTGQFETKPAAERSYLDKGVVRSSGQPGVFPGRQPPPEEPAGRPVRGSPFAEEESHGGAPSRPGVKPNRPAKRRPSRLAMQQSGHLPRARVFAPRNHSNAAG